MQAPASSSRESVVKISSRAQRIVPFYAMEVAKAAAEIRDPALPMIELIVGEPDQTAAPLVQAAAERVIREGRTQYTQALGIPELRERISDWYRQRFGLSIPARRILVTAGASAALQLICMALIEQGDEVLMPDPSYPCNRHFVIGAEGTPVAVPTTAANRFQLTADQVREHWGERTRGVLLASPSNPTGTSIALDELGRMHDFVQTRGGVTLIDEIYLGLSHDDAYAQSALALDEQIISINSFSKYFSMTGWRLGWAVVPDALAPVIERLAQNLFLCPNVIAQRAALACFEPESIAEFERRRADYRARRDWFIPALEGVGFKVPVMPDGAFYAWADCSAWCEAWGLSGSWDFAFELMRRAHIAVTPGRDFGRVDAERFIRLSTATSMEKLKEAIGRLQALRG